MRILRPSLIKRRAILGGTAALVAAPFVMRVREPMAAATNTQKARTHLTQPAAAAEAHYNNLTLWDDFDTVETIDVNATQKAGFNWWPFGWPTHANPGSPAPLSPGHLVVANSVVTIGTERGAKINSRMFPSDYSTVSTGIGRTFSNGFYCEVKMQWNPNDGQKRAGSWWPSVWFWEEQYALEQAQTTKYGPYEPLRAELDLWEAPFPTDKPGTITPCSTHQWTDSYSQPYGTTGNVNGNLIDYTRFNRYGLRWIPMAKNHGTGRLDWYFNDAHLPVAPGPSVTYTAKDRLAATDNGNYILLIGTPGRWPLRVDSVMIWQ